MYDVGSPLTLVCRASGIFLKNLVIPREDARHGMFAGHPVGAEEVVRFYDGSLQYLDLSGQKQLMKTYGVGVMSVSVEQF